MINRNTEVCSRGLSRFQACLSGYYEHCTTRFITQFGVILCLLMSLVACNLNQVTKPTVSSNVTPNASVDHQQTFTIGPASVTSGLDELNSYRANLIVEFDGRRAGQSIAGHIESLTEVGTKPNHRRYYLRIKTDTPTEELRPGIGQFIRLGERVYIKQPTDNHWVTLTAADVEPADVDFFDLSRLIVLPETVSRSPRYETLADQLVRRYDFDEADLTDPNLIFEQATGTVWLDDAERYVVQYIISTTLRVDIPDPQAPLIDDGHLNLSYSLTDIDTDIIIQPPAPPVSPTTTLETLPQLPDAVVTSQFPDLLEYTSSYSATGAAYFYREQLPEQGWREEESDIFEEKAELHFSAEDQRLTILILPLTDSRKINIVLNVK